MVPVEIMDGRSTESCADLREVCVPTLDLSPDVPAFVGADLERGRASGFADAGKAKASSAKASVTLWAILFGWAGVAGAFFWSKANFPPDSCRRENCSSGGNRDEISSTGTLAGAKPGFESSAAKGSLETILKGDGLGRVPGCAAFVVVGLPRLIGVISGRVIFSSKGAAL
jgi:hypothetical protein